jgi:hypothetical protein
MYFIHSGFFHPHGGGGGLVGGIFAGQKPSPRAAVDAPGFA